MGASQDNLIAVLRLPCRLVPAAFFDQFAVSCCATGFTQAEVFAGVDASFEAIPADVKQAV